MGASKKKKDLVDPSLGKEEYQRKNYKGVRERERVINHGVIILKCQQALFPPSLARSRFRAFVSLVKKN